MHHKMNNKTFESTYNAVRRMDTGSRNLTEANFVCLIQTEMSLMKTDRQTAI